jgi:hypothetical protein
MLGDAAGGPSQAQWMLNRNFNCSVRKPLNDAIAIDQFVGI